MRIKELFDSISSSKNPLSELELTQLSSIRPAEHEKFSQAWVKLSHARREQIIDQLETRSHMFLTNDIGVAIYNAEPEDGLKGKCIELMDATESSEALEITVNAALNNTNKQIRLEAIGKLGLCAYYLEIEEIEENIGETAVETLFKLKKDPDVEIQQAALIAVSFLSADEVENWIKEAFVKQNIAWQETAMRAVGNNLSNEWTSRVIDGLYSKAPGIRQAAINSAGEMGLETARDRLIELLDEEVGSDLFEDVIEALAKIGGDQIQTIFEAIMANTDDEELKEFIQESIEELVLTDPDSFKEYWAEEFGDDEGFDLDHDHDHDDDE